MRNTVKVLILSFVALIAQTRLLFADSVSVVESHTSSTSTKTTNYTILGMDQTTGMIVIAVGVLVLILIVVMLSRSSSKTETTVIK